MDFWSNVDKTGECWEWTGLRRRGKWQYGRIGAYKMAHRVSWEMHFGPIPPGMLVCHHCDNPPCVRPAHLFLGTPLANQRDMIAKGRKINRPLAGSENGRAKLTPEAVALIRAAWRRRKVTQRMLADLYGVSEITVWRILHGRLWSA